VVPTAEVDTVVSLEQMDRVDTVVLVELQERVDIQAQVAQVDIVVCPVSVVRQHLDTVVCPVSVELLQVVILVLVGRLERLDTVEFLEPTVQVDIQESVV